MLFLLAMSSSTSICINTTNSIHLSAAYLHQAKLPFCSEHSSRTCCDQSASLSIYKKLHKSLQDPPFFEDYEGYSSPCLSYSQKGLCSECDGDM